MFAITRGIANMVCDSIAEFNFNKTGDIRRQRWQMYQPGNQQTVYGKPTDKDILCLVPYATFFFLTN